MPLPKNTKEVLSGHKKILVCENNNGQFVNYLREKMPDFKYEQFNKIQGLPFLTAELENKFNDLLK
jgi:2-oxoglutarate ferredoxin oxidoreductase subunit alpha